jgi:dolichyl-diphosphooligosaccharide--protein glycosyltransferase
LLYIIQKKYKERGISIWKSLGITLGFLGLALILGLIFFIVTVPTKELSVIIGIISFFNNPYAGTIAETARWSLDRAVSVYSSGLLLAALGLIICIKKYRNPLFLFIAVWSAVMLGFTISSMRFEYYLGVNIAILAAIGTIYGYGYLAEWSVHVRETFATRTRLQRLTNYLVQRLTKYLGIWIKLMIILGVVSFVGYSIYLVTLESTSARATMPEDWSHALSWLQLNSPADGMDYYALYPSTGFSYPPEAYSIMALGDYGHWILAVANRMPVSNPFQSNLGSTTGVATFFMTEDPATAYNILNDTKSKYIIVDQSMTGEKLENIIAWSSPKQPLTRYILHKRYTNQFLKTTLGKLWYGTMDNITLVYTSPHKTVKIFKYGE